MKLLIIGISDNCENIKNKLKNLFSVIDIVSDVFNVNINDYDYVFVSSNLIKNEEYLRLVKPSGFSYDN